MAMTVDSTHLPRSEDERGAPESSGPQTAATSQPRRARGDVALSEGRTIVSRSVPRRRRALPDRAARERDIERLVAASVKDYKEHMAMVGSFREEAEGGALRPIPRRKRSKNKPGPPPEIPAGGEETFKASAWATVSRFFGWYQAYLVYQFGVAWDKARKRDSAETRAERLLRLFQRMGGTAVKIGQQLSMRVDLLPYEYCKALAKLLDTVGPFPVEDAIKAVERSTRKPLDETFLIFDPKPIGSASMACVYQAVLKDGRKVAVKVRRPDIGKLFAADLRAIGWLINVLEALTLLRPGYLQNFVKDFENVIREELDFKMEAYHQALFKSEAKKFTIKGKPICSAPDLMFELSSGDVIVEEFVSGVWMWEILAAVESKDQDALTRMRKLNIDPKVVARRMLHIQMWGQYISTIFHADPHPANIIVQQDNEIVFIDFGACGAMTRTAKEGALDQLSFMLERDLSGVVKCMLSILEPLPPIDMDQFAQDVETRLWQSMQALWSKRGEWHEKTSLSGMLALTGSTQASQMPMNLDTVRAFRASLLYDTIALRAYPELDLVNNSKRFTKFLDKNAEKGAKKALRKRLKSGLISGSEIRTITGLAGIMTRGLNTMRRFVDQPVVNFAYLTDKSSFLIIELIRLASILAVMLLTPSVFIMLFRLYHGAEFDLLAIMRQVATHQLFYVAAGMVSLVTVRRIALRLGDAKVE